MLSAILNILEEEIRKRKRADSMKTVLKKSSIKKMKRRLRSAQCILLLSSQIYLAQVKILQIRLYSVV
jgi:hypothetical protein